MGADWMGEDGVKLAVAALADESLVVLPTETVYGLAGLALSEVAVAKIFAAKGRPSHNPLIVHLGQVSDVVRVAVPANDRWQRLADALWPGPLTLVLPKHDSVPGIVTAGGDTVAVRIPAHPLFLRVLSELGQPLAAPSANIFTTLSPTRAQDVSLEIRAHTAGILDGGPCQVGIESTVLDLTTDVPRVLRRGVLSAATLSGVLGERVAEASSEPAPNSPGQHPRHYAPRATITFVEGHHNEPGLVFESASSAQRLMPSDPSGYAQALYAALASLDRAGEPHILVQRPPTTPEWDAVWDRLNRASYEPGGR